VSRGKDKRKRGRGIERSQKEMGWKTVPTKVASDKRENIRFLQGWVENAADKKKKPRRKKRKI